MINNQIAKQTPNLEVRDKIASVEERMLQMPGVMKGDCFPLKHEFVDGAYVREITMPKGALLTSKIHKVTHPYFILKGDVSVLTEEGVVRIKAPFSGITKAGTKRLLYIHEETVWTTVHVTDKTDLNEIEAEIIAKDFSEIDEERKTMLEHTTLITQNCLIKSLMENNRDFLSLLTLKPKDNLLPFKESLDVLKAHNISLDGLYAIKQSDNLWHIVSDIGIPLSELQLTETDMVGTWAAIAVSAIVVSTGITAYSTFQQGQAQAQIAEMNATTARRNAHLVSQRMDIQKIQTNIEIEKHRERLAKVLGAQRAGFSKAGVVTTEGTPLIVQAETAAESKIDELAIGFAGSVEQSRLTAELSAQRQEALLQQMAGGQAKIAGNLGAGASLLSGIGSAISAGSAIKSNTGVSKFAEA